MTKDQPDPADPHPPLKEVDKAGTDKHRDDDVAREAPAPVRRITDWAAF